MRACSGCGAALRRNPGESWRAYVERRHCGPGCYHAARVVQVEAVQCAHCGRDIERGENEKPSWYAGRRFCGADCHQAARRVVRHDGAECETCGAPLGRKHYGGRIEPAESYLRRRFCSDPCRVAAGRSSGATSERQLRAEARRHRLDYCEGCGATGGRLHAHHVDRDIDNNSAANIQTLCDECHTTVHSVFRRCGVPVGLRMPTINRSSAWGSTREPAS